MTMAELLRAERVTKVFRAGGSFFGRERTIALQDFSLALAGDRPSVIAIAGESGSGKTTLARLLLGMIEPTEGRVLYRGKHLQEMSRNEWRAFRQDVQAVFQDPFGVYNPFYKVDHLLTTAVRKFGLAGSNAQARELIEDALHEVGLRPEETLGRNPHQLSGGQRQRVTIARVLLLNPRIVVADEPVSMVDASLRATILENLLKLYREFGISLLYITHDLATAYQLAEAIIILYRGAVMEMGDVEALIKSPQHPYTQLLIESIPLPDPDTGWDSLGKQADDDEPKPGEEARGCKFASRCPHAMDICRSTPPPLFDTDGRRGVACHLYSESPVTEQVAAMTRLTSAAGPRS
jgi:oligopeptide/dipeptide ABC transporter ATP-binding protein